eukprot:COSAG04_NODE_3126_length_3141_cov_5.249178_1_plen_167_part_10
MLTKFGYFTPLLEEASPAKPLPLWGPPKLAAQARAIEAAKRRAERRRLAKARAAERAKERAAAKERRRAAKARRNPQHESLPHRPSPKTPVLWAYLPREESEGEAGIDNNGTLELMQQHGSEMTAGSWLSQQGSPGSGRNQAQLAVKEGKQAQMVKMGKPSRLGIVD